MSGFAWSWADYEREARKDAARMAKAAPRKNDSTPGISPRSYPTADTAGGREGRAAEGRKPDVTSGAAAKRMIAPANARQLRIDLTHAPSAMEQSAERWRGQRPDPMAQHRPCLPEGQVLCGCGARHGKEPGPVPAWFGRDCIETGCPLKGAV